MLNALTFDVEDYFHVESFAQVVSPDRWAGFETRVADNTRKILDLLDRHGVSATFFVLGWVAEREPDLIRAVAERGHEVGCHSYAHQMITRLDRDAFRADLRRARAAIEDLIGAPVRGYRAPTFSVVRGTLWALEILAEEGFEYDSSIFPIHHDRYGIPDAARFPHRVALSGGGSIVEFPMTTVRIGPFRWPFSGGGYFRLLPYALIQAGLRRVNELDAMPAMVYLHPWEFDPAQPRLPVRGLARFRHYVNLDRTAAKLERLLGAFAFAPAAEVLRQHALTEAA